jgi:PAS domain S-box-containing protein
VNNGYEWCAEEVGSQIEKFTGIELKDFPLLAERIRKFENLYIPSVAELPLAAKADRGLLELLRIESLIVVPMVSGKAVTGLLGFDWVSEGKSWPDDTVALIKIVGEIFVNALERKRAEEALRESEEKYRTITSTAQDGIIMSDSEGNISYWNPAAERIFGYTKEEAIGRELHIFHGPDRYSKGYKMEFKKFRKTEQGMAAGKTLELWGIKKDGTEFPIELSVSTVQIAGKWHTTGIIRDITDRKQAEEEKKKLETQLQQSQKMEAIGTLAGGIAHDFNNILFAIIGFSEIAMDDVPEGSMARANMKEVLTASMRAKGLVKHIIAFSRQAEQERMPLQIQPIVKEALELLRASLPSTIEISQNIDKECGAVLAEPTQIHQVVMNLCANAYHAMREDGGVLEVTLAEVDIDSSVLDSNLDLNPGPYLGLTVSDTGHGMERVVTERIFEPYFTTKGMGEGTGMGLSVVHGIVKSYGGDIRVYSEPGKGTTFHVYLPRIATSAIAPETVSAEPAPRGKERILFVDDEVQIVHMMREMLERLGYHVTARTSSVEALEAFRAQPEKFDLVITDQTMPNMTGVELSKELMRIRPNIPIILCTGFSEVISEEEAKAIGIRDYVMKPVVQTQIANRIRQVLNQEKEKGRRCSSNGNAPADAKA